VKLSRKDGKKVFDLGCRVGDNIDLFFAVNPDIVWYGLDVDF